ncbi:MAG: membrane dipeptidase [Firmicutes bacterium]|nr:membrane dipeptidase [Bacillota bacterium]
MNFEDMSLAFSGSFPLRADGHCDTFLALKENKCKHIDIEQMHRYMDMQFAALFVEEENDPVKAKEILDDLYFYYRTLQTEEFYDLWIPLKNGESFRRLESDNIGIVLAVENCAPFGADEDAVWEAYDRGFRSFGIVWNHSNCMAGGAFSDDGLTDKGERLIRNLNRLPVAVDLAHMNEKSFYEALSVIEHPPIVTHTCCYDLNPHCRNLKENQMKELRMAGGLMCITFVDKFLKENPQEASMDAIIDHILYASDFMGIDKVALGSDFDGADMPFDLDSQKSLPDLYKRMKERDFSDDEINMVAGENLFRYMIKTLSREES